MTSVVTRKQKWAMQFHLICGALLITSMPDVRVQKKNYPRQHMSKKKKKAFRETRLKTEAILFWVTPDSEVINHFRRVKTLLCWRDAQHKCTVNTSLGISPGHSLWFQQHLLRTSWAYQVQSGKMQLWTVVVWTSGKSLNLQLSCSLLLPWDFIRLPPTFGPTFTNLPSLLQNMNVNTRFGRALNYLNLFKKIIINK